MVELAMIPSVSILQLANRSLIASKLGPKSKGYICEIYFYTHAFSAERNTRVHEVFGPSL